VQKLKQVWENTNQMSGIWTSPVIEEFFADVRAFNQELPVAKRIRILLADPPVDWVSVKSRANEDMNDWRDAHIAWVVEKQVINKGGKALLFAGGRHTRFAACQPRPLSTGCNLCSHATAQIS
jgi:hypothetical protein